jgi:gluconokinase
LDVSRGELRAIKSDGQLVELAGPLSTCRATTPDATHAHALSAKLAVASSIGSDARRLIEGPAGERNMIVLLMGVSGVGKTTIGQALAREVHWRFADADDFHPASNVAKMRAGNPLDDADRAPWLELLHDAIARWVTGRESVVLACSALKETYREKLLVGPEVKLVYLHGDFNLIAQRLTMRHGHYMNPGLLRSQFETLEVPEDSITIDVSGSVPDIVVRVRRALEI